MTSKVCSPTASPCENRDASGEEFFRLERDCRIIRFVRERERRWRLFSTDR